MHQKAWALLLRKIEGKTSWGKNELKQLMLECLTEVEEPEPDRMYTNRAQEMARLGYVKVCSNCQGRGCMACDGGPYTP